MLLKNLIQNSWNIGVLAFSLAILSSESAFSADGNYSLSSIDQNWLDDFETISGKKFTIKPDPDGPPSQRMKVVYDMESMFVPSDAGKTLKEVFGRPEFGMKSYSVFYNSGGSTFPQAPPEFFTVDYDPAGRLGIKRKVIRGEEVPHSGIYLQFVEKPGVTQACVSVDMFIPSDFEFGITQGKFGFGLNAGSHPNNGGSTPPEDQDGAGTRTVRGLGYDVRPYSYALNRVELTGNLYGYSPSSENAPVPHGEWVRYEMEIKINDIGQSNGFVKMWANGVKFSQYSNLVFRTETQPFLLNEIFINDMWQVNHDYQDKVPLKSGHYWYSNYKIMVPGIPDIKSDVGPDWSLDYQSIEFGNNVVGGSSDFVATITNVSGVDGTGVISVDSDAFSVLSGDIIPSLAAGESHKVVLRYLPTSPGQHYATLRVEGGSGLSVPLEGVASVLQDASVDLLADTGTLIGTMEDRGNYISTNMRDEGTAIYAINIPATGTYKVTASVNAAASGSNSFVAGFDEFPVGSHEIWDILPLTSGFESRDVTARGLNGSFENPEFDPAIWQLSAGIHYLIVLGREVDTQLKSLMVVKVGDDGGVSAPVEIVAPNNLRVE